jgi:purine-binding chemotaxis protein CheW
MQSVERESGQVSKVLGALHTASFGGGEFLTVRIGAETYAFEILKVQEIRSFTEPTRIVGAGDSTLGVINLRGVIVPIVDLRKLLGLDVRASQAAPVVVVLTFSNRTVGVLVDSVCEVIQIGSAELRPAPSMGVAAGMSHVMGLASLPGSTDGVAQLCIVTDVENLARSALGAADPTTQVLQ